ncbi:GNAT family N-acetyltransferase [Azospirillaceae bacterium]
MEGLLDPVMRDRYLAYFERLGERRVRLYSRINCDRFLGNWQVRELADHWLEAKDYERIHHETMIHRQLRRLLKPILYRSPS